MLTDTIALVLCGGESSRMGTDKSMLQYYDKPQRYHLYDMLQPFCEQVFISVNESQLPSMEKGYNFLTDLPQYNNIGPMVALLTAFEKFPQKNILLIGCDYPFLSITELINFSVCCTTTPLSFYNAGENICEPLLAWYPAYLSEKLIHMHANGQFSLQAFLKSSHVSKYYPANELSIMSVDTNKGFINACKLISKVY